MTKAPRRRLSIGNQLRRQRLMSVSQQRGRRSAADLAGLPSAWRTETQSVFGKKGVSPQFPVCVFACVRAAFITLPGDRIETLIDCFRCPHTSFLHLLSPLFFFSVCFFFFVQSLLDSEQRQQLVLLPGLSNSPPSCLIKQFTLRAREKRRPTNGASGRKSPCSTVRRM